MLLARPVHGEGKGTHCDVDWSYIRRRSADLHIAQPEVAQTWFLHVTVALW